MTEEKNYTIYKEQREAYIETGENERNKLDNILVNTSIAFVSSSLIYLGITDSFKYILLLFLSIGCFMFSVIFIIRSCKNSELAHSAYVDELDRRWKEKEDLYQPISSEYDEKIANSNSYGEKAFLLGVILIAIFIGLLIQ